MTGGMKSRPFEEAEKGAECVPLVIIGLFLAGLGVVNSESSMGIALIAFGFVFMFAGFLRMIRLWGKEISGTWGMDEK